VSGRIWMVQSSLKTDVVLLGEGDIVILLLLMELPSIAVENSILISWLTRTFDHSELQEEFEDEIEELLMGWRKNNEIETPAFARFVRNAVRWDYERDPYNFRLSLLYEMQRVVATLIPIFAKMDFDKDAGPFGISETIVKPDMNRAFVWAGLYAKNTLKSENQMKWEDLDRPVLF
jgi:hypothetical protein